jgi:hypothetical protein
VRVKISAYRRNQQITTAESCAVPTVTDATGA